MPNKFITLSFGIGALLLAASHAFSQPGRSCGDRARVIDRLQSGYGEARHGMGLAANNHVLEVFASEATGTWTIIVTSPTGVTCQVASGQSFELHEGEIIDAGPAL